MKKVFFTFSLFLFSIISYSQIMQPGKRWSQVLLPNGWSLTPAGKSVPLGDLPLNMAVSKSKSLIAVTNNGYSDQSVELVDVTTGKVVDSMPVSRSWYGLKFSDNDKYLYASGGNDNWILKYEVVGKKLKFEDSIKLGKKWPTEISPSGFDIDDEKNLMYVVTKENNSLYVVNLKTKKVEKTLPLGGEGYMCLLAPDKKELYISCWGCDQVKIFNAENNTFTDSLHVGDNPNEMLLSKNGKWLYVANANDNSVSVIDIKSRKVVEVLNAALYPDAPPGSTTNGLAFSEDEKTLFIANADNNCLSVFDVSMPGSSKSKGFIPVGWYPTNVKVVGRKIYVTNGKGFTSYANPWGPNPVNHNHHITFHGADSTVKTQYIGGLMRATLSIIDIPNEKQLGLYSQQVYKNTPYNKRLETQSWVGMGNPVPSKIGGKSPIKHVFYIIKENRTYDQVLGDVKEGNGDPSLVLFGEKITPNQHAIAKQFVLLDNFYASAEVSADGHNWSMGGYATDYLEKNWPTNYGHHSGHYDSEGTREIANNKNGFIWNFCKRAGVTYRTYGEFADDYMPNIPVLKDHYCPYYTSWDQKVRDTTRFNQWKREFDSLLAINKVPQLSTLRLINDHTEGLAKNRPTPFVHVADNDWAVGLFIEHLSQSPIWKESVVFVVEDDAQDGPDHVDAHRTTAYVAGGYIKTGFVDHTMYSTTSILRTIELILGLPPMSQYDASSTPMWRCFSSKPDHLPFHSIPVELDLTLKNVAINKWQKLSETFDLTKEDAVPEALFNQVLWHGIKGDNVPLPAPRRAAFIKVKDEKDDD